MSSSSSHYIPRGTVFPFHGTVAPSGWHLCDGNGTYTNEAGDVVIIPDLRGRSVLGAGSGDGLTTRALNSNGGAETHTLTIPELPSHNHNSTNSTDVSGYVDASGAHIHTFTSSNDNYDNGTNGEAYPGTGNSNNYPSFPAHDIGGISTTWNNPVNSSGIHQHKIYATGGGAAHTLMNPFYVLNYIIKV
jgi:microcystin-dependent protein